MSAPSQTCTVLFADVAGSTGLYLRLGDAVAQRLMSQAIQRLTTPVRVHGGTLVKTIGDAILCTFPTPVEAAGAALQMQREAQPPVTVRIGFHHGAVIHQASDVFGDCVNVASRLSTAARGGQILISEVSAVKLSPALLRNTRPFDVATFKGQEQPMRVIELLWEETRDVTQIGTRGGSFGGRGQSVFTKLRFNVSGRPSEVAPPFSKYSIGRDATCSLPVNAPLASRVHAELDYQRGKFVLSDHSTNGTYVTDAGGREVFLRRESMPLTGSGTISLGAPLSEQQGEVVRFTTE